MLTVWVLPLGLPGRESMVPRTRRAAGIYKNLNAGGISYLPEGYDGVDNNTTGTGAGLVDEWGEGVTTANQALVQANLTNHKHSTARSEMLYALLVEGRGAPGLGVQPRRFL